MDGPSNTSERLDEYLYSENGYIAEMFDADVTDRGVQPSLTKAELNALDMLVERIPVKIQREFDQKYLNWIDCWMPLDSIPDHQDVYYSLECNGNEFRELVEFCRQQNDEILLLLYQLASRAQCPYDQLLLYPVHELLATFPEFERYWEEVNLSLQSEKPNPENRTCNESTVWYTRKILENKYKYIYTSRLASLFGSY